MSLLSVAAIAGCNSKPRLTAEEAAGKALYTGRCAHCHEENDLALRPPPPSLHNIGDHGLLPSGDAATDVAIERVVTHGKGMMPAFAGRFTPEQFKSMTAYLRTGLR